MWAKMKRSFQLLGYTIDILKQEKKLLVFPALSGIAAVLLIVSFIPLLPASEEYATYTDEQFDSVVLALLFLLYIAEYFVVFFFNSALVACVLKKLDGGTASIGYGFNHATSRVISILGYALIAATVGVILRAISERIGFIGQLVIGFLGAAWSIATFLTVPVLVNRDVGPIDAVKQSMQLLKSTWGENLTANVGLGFVFGAFYLLGICLFGLLFAAGLINTGEGFAAAFALLILLVTFIALVHAALQGIYSAVLYHHAVSNDPDYHNPTLQQPNDLLGSAFTVK